MSGRNRLTRETLVSAVHAGTRARQRRVHCPGGQLVELLRWGPGPESLLHRRQRGADAQLERLPRAGRSGRHLREREPVGRIRSADRPAARLRTCQRIGQPVPERGRAEQRQLQLLWRPRLGDHRRPLGQPQRRARPQPRGTGRHRRGPHADPQPSHDREHRCRCALGRPVAVHARGARQLCRDQLLGADLRDIGIESGRRQPRDLLPLGRTAARRSRRPRRPDPNAEGIHRPEHGPIHRRPARRPQYRPSPRLRRERPACRQRPSELYPADQCLRRLDPPFPESPAASP